MTAARQPNQSDLLSLAQTLAAFDVECVVIGGAAMALHGFPRMTKDIDLLLPVDPDNNSRLLRALASMPQNTEALAQLRQHVQTVVLNGILVVTLDVDGLLQTKRTPRASDIPDRLKLERLKNALRERELK